MNSLYTLDQLLKEQQEASIENSANNFDKLIKCSSDVIQSLHDGKAMLEEREIYIEPLVIKIIYASKSMYTLTKGMKISSNNPELSMEIIDRSSVYLLTRSIIEALLTLEYLYYNDEPKDLKEFRFKLWKVSGLRARQNHKFASPAPWYMYKYNAKTKAHKKQRAEEEEVIEQLMQELRESSYFQNLTKRNIENLELFGYPRMLSWTKLKEASILETVFLKNMYRICSDHAHSEYLSAIQINELSPLSKDPGLISGIKLGITVASIINSVVIILLKDRFKCAEIIYNALPEQQYNRINLWYSLGVNGVP